MFVDKHEFHDSYMKYPYEIIRKIAKGGFLPKSAVDLP